MKLAKTKIILGFVVIILAIVGYTVYANQKNPPKNPQISSTAESTKPTQTAVATTSVTPRTTFLATPAVPKPVQEQTQSPKPSTANITWSASRKLTWNDFQGVPGNSGKASVSLRIDSGWTRAYTCENIDTGARCVIKIESVKSLAEVNPLKSWFLSSYNTDYRLAHEQDHFNITEVFARKARKQLGPLVGYSVTTEAQTQSEALQSGT